MTSDTPPEADTRTITPNQEFDVTLELPGSKSITNRAMLLAGLSDGPSMITGTLHSQDTVAFADALTSVGGGASWDGDTLRVMPLPEGHRGHVCCQDAGTAARFLPPTAAALRATIDFDGSTQLRARPMAPLLDALRQQGALIHPDSASHLPFRLVGRGLVGGDLHIASQMSSQFLSGLLMAAPLATNPLTIHSAGIVSRPYVDLTIDMMSAFGARVERSGYEKFHIDNSGRYRGRSYTVEADASTASYFFAAAAVTKSRVRVKNLRRASLQGDIRFLDVLEQMGISVTDDDGGVVAQGPQSLHGVDIDMSDFSDVSMTLACVAPFATTPTHIRNIAHVRFKESDRIAATLEGLHALGVRAEADANSLTIHPSVPHGGAVETRNDHRIAMAFSVIGLRTPGVTIRNPSCVDKTCPNFFELWSKLETPDAAQTFHQASRERDE